MARHMLEEMIARHWSARATRDGAEGYLRFFVDKLVPELDKIDGHRGAEVFVRSVGDIVEITVLTFWDTMEAVRQFSGATPDRAVVEPEARALLASFDTDVRHLTLRVDTSRATREGAG